MECTTPSYSMRPFPDGRFLLPFLLLVLSRIHLSVALSTMFNSPTKSIKDRACFVSSENYFNYHSNCRLSTLLEVDLGARLATESDGLTHLQGMVSTLLVSKSDNHWPSSQSGPGRRACTTADLRKGQEKKRAREISSVESVCRVRRKLIHKAVHTSAIWSMRPDFEGL